MSPEDSSGAPACTVWLPHSDAGHSPGKTKMPFCDPPGPLPDLNKRMSLYLYMISKISTVRLAWFDIVCWVVLGLQVACSLHWIWTFIPFSMPLLILKWMQLFCFSCIVFMGFSLLFCQSRLWTWLLSLDILTHYISLNISAQKSPWHHLDLQRSDWPDTHTAGEWCGLAKWLKCETSFWPWSSVHELENPVSFLDLPGLGFFTSCSVWAIQWSPTVYRKGCANCHWSEGLDFILIYWRRKELQGKQKIRKVSFPDKMYF